MWVLSGSCFSGSSVVIVPSSSKSTDFPFPAPQREQQQSQSSFPAGGQEPVRDQFEQTKMVQLTCLNYFSIQRLNSQDFSPEVLIQNTMCLTVLGSLSVMLQYLGKNFSLLVFSVCWIQARGSGYYSCGLKLLMHTLLKDRGILAKTCWENLRHARSMCVIVPHLTVGQSQQKESCKHLLFSHN